MVHDLRPNFAAAGPRFNPTASGNLLLRIRFPCAGSLLEVGGDLGELVEGGLEVFRDFGGDDVGVG